MNRLLFHLPQTEKMAARTTVVTLVIANILASPVHGQALNAPSVVRAEKEALLSSQISGQVISLPFKEGESFTAGQILVDIDCTLFDLEAAAALAESRGKKAISDARDALFARGGGGQLEVEAARADAAAATARAQAASVRVSHCQVAAPFDGRLVERSVNEHELVEPGKPLLSIVSTGRPDIEIIAPAEWLEWVQVGTPGLLRLEATRQELMIEVQSIGPTVDPVSRTVALSAQLLGDVAGVLPGMSGLVELERP